MATDGSDHAARAVGLAADLASKYGARLLIVAVVEYGPVSTELRALARSEGMVEPESQPHVSAIAGIPGWMNQAIRDAHHVGGGDHEILESIAKRALDEAAESARKAGVTRVETHLEHGDPAEHILGIADGEAVDMIVTGRRGLGRVRGLLLGSVSTKIAQHAPCTCVTVR